MLRKTVQAMKIVNGYTHDEEQYTQLIRDILTEGSWEDGRNGWTKCVFGSAMHFSLADNVLPLLTTKKVAWKTCLKELLWFIRGQTNNQLLQEQNVHIWDGNAAAHAHAAAAHEADADANADAKANANANANADAMAKANASAGNDLGPIYGHQWRHFNAPYTHCNADYSGAGIDQLGDVISQLKNPATRSSRRLVVSAWNPCQLQEMALPPCHILMQFNVTGGDKLSCSMYQRSGDVGLGVPFNIASYAFLVHLIAHHCGLVAHEFLYYLGNCHIYDDHVEALKTQCQRTPLPFPTVCIRGAPKALLDDYTIDDFVVENYLAHDMIKMNMRP